MPTPYFISSSRYYIIAYSVSAISMTGTGDHLFLWYFVRLSIQIFTFGIKLPLLFKISISGGPPGYSSSVNLKWYLPPLNGESGAPGIVICHTSICFLFGMCTWNLFYNWNRLYSAASLCILAFIDVSWHEGSDAGRSLYSLLLAIIYF